MVLKEETERRRKKENDNSFFLTFLFIFSEGGWKSNQVFSCCPILFLLPLSLSSSSSFFLFSSLFISHPSSLLPLSIFVNFFLDSNYFFWRKLTFTLFLFSSSLFPFFLSLAFFSLFFSFFNLIFVFTKWTCSWQVLINSNFLFILFIVSFFFLSLTPFLSPLFLPHYHRSNDHLLTMPGVKLHEFNTLGKIGK